MNTEPKEHFTMAITGQLTISREAMTELLRSAQAEAAIVEAPPALTEKPGGGKGVPRLAFTMRETAEILGVSYVTVHRLLQRGLLRSSLASRHKIISKVEIERFLKETSRSIS